MTEICCLGADSKSYDKTIELIKDPQALHNQGYANAHKFANVCKFISEICKFDLEDVYLLCFFCQNCDYKCVH